MQKPNILFVMADQMTAMALQLYGRGAAKTPALDKLAARGVMFENAYCNSPLCGPSRQSMMTGKLPSAVAGYDNATVLPSDVPTYAHYLNLGGYRTALSGKMHFVGADQLHGFQERLTTDIYPADFSWTPNWSNPDAKVRFQDMQNVLNAGPCARSMQIDYDEDVAYQAQRWIFDRARDGNGDGDGDDTQPWALTVSFTSPHDPYTPLPEFWDLYNDGDIEPPRITADQCPPDAHSTRLRKHYSIDDANPSDAQLRTMRRGYYGCISYVDAKLAELVQVLEETGQIDNTIIIFTSDHGDMMGERGLYYKKNFFEWAMRVPMVIAGPTVGQGRVDRPVSLVDILPTFCEIAGVAPLQSDGQSLLSGNSAPVYGEYLSEGVFEPLFMIRQGDYKLIYAQHDAPLLFNLSEDPDELHNLAPQPEAADILQNMIALANGKWAPDALKAEIIESQNRRHLLQKTDPAQWDYAPDLSQSQRYVRAGKWTVEVEAKAHLEVQNHKGLDKNGIKPCNWRF